MADDYDSAHSYYRANSSGGRRHRRATASAAGQAQAQEGADFALNEDLDYLASSAFEHFDINHILESIPIQYEQSGSIPEHPPLIRSSSEPQVPGFRPLAPTPMAHNNYDQSAYTGYLPHHDPAQQNYAGPFYEDYIPSPTGTTEDPLAPIEEEKRRRNTAASARFRVKKKERELALEKTAKDMTEKCAKLESRVQGLETENRWLRGLIVEKSRNTSGPAKEEFEPEQSERRKSDGKGKGKSGEKVRSLGKRNDGVGTKY